MIDIFFRGFVDGYDGFLGGGIDCLEGLAVFTFDEFVIDEAGVVMVSNISWRGRVLGAG